MKIAIQGVDYTSALDAAHPLTIERKLNEPSVCQMALSLPSGGVLATPLRNQYLAVTGDNGTAYFTGYIRTAPLPEFAGLGMEGPRYRIVLQALSDEAILDMLAMPACAGAAGELAGPLVASLAKRSGSNSLSTQGLTLNAPVSYFSAEPGTPWSKSAGVVASQARASYRALNGTLSLVPVQNTVHTLNEADGSLSLENLTLTASAKRALANDATVCGEHEPVAYVTEYFSGDGSTTTFYLSEAPFFLPSSKSTVIHESFNGAQIDSRLWAYSGGPGYLSLGAGGLTMSGGDGTDGDVLLTWIDPVEMGGTLLLEATGVTLSPGSTGILAGFFSGLEKQAGCIAGFQATAQQGTGAVTLQPIVQGNPCGATHAVNPANQYILQIRIHCPEQERAQAVYRSFGDNGPIACGGTTSSAPGKLLIDIVECVGGAVGTPTVLFDGAIANLPAACMAVAASGVNLIGTMRGLSLVSLGSGWVVDTPPNGGPFTRRVGTVAELSECQVERTGKAVFNAGFAPVAGEQVAVSYRTVGRAVGRAVNAASQQALAQAGMPSVSTWIGSVTSPAARSSADCRNAALAIEEAAAGTSALWSGSYKGTGRSLANDVWPGDALLLVAPSASLNLQVAVRTVRIGYRASCPDLIEYAIEFANDWADDLAIKTSATVPADAWLPAPIAPTLLANLTGLTVTALSGRTVTIDAGVPPPSGGGFEIRRRDFAFMPGEDTDLVMRASTQVMTLTRLTAFDRFYIRMYDGATPPNYSEFSTALFFNLPMGV
jgi:hypothetical protein